VNWVHVLWEHVPNPGSGISWGCCGPCVLMLTNNTDTSGGHIFVNQPCCHSSDKCWWDRWQFQDASHDVESHSSTCVVWTADETASHDTEPAIRWLTISLRLNQVLYNFSLNHTPNQCWGYCFIIIIIKQFLMCTKSMDKTLNRRHGQSLGA